MGYPVDDPTFAHNLCLRTLFTARWSMLPPHHLGESSSFAKEPNNTSPVRGPNKTVDRQGPWTGRSLLAWTPPGTPCPSDRTSVVVTLSCSFMSNVLRFVDLAMWIVHLLNQVTFCEPPRGRDKKCAPLADMRRHALPGGCLLPSMVCSDVSERVMRARDSP